MSKSMFALAAACAALALSPLAASAAGLQGIYDASGEYQHDLENCSTELPPADGQLASGRIVAVDPAAGRITLDYRPIPLLPEGGVRIFTVEDPASLKGLRPGDRIRFEVERDGRRFVVTHVENSN